MNQFLTICLSALVLAASAKAQDAGDAEEAKPTATLPEILKSIGDQLAAATAVCSFVERTTVEELDSDRKVKAREVHTYRVEQTGSEVKRTFVDAKKEVGELNSKLRPKPDSELSKDEKERRRRFKTAFHLEEQKNYRFKFASPPAKGRATIAFQPIEPTAEKGVGTATVDLESGQLLTINSKPSKFPVFLSEMDIRTNFANTPCGSRATRFEISGEGGLLFLRMRFHSITALSEYALISK